MGRGYTQFAMQKSLELLIMVAVTALSRVCIVRT